ncbi:hypothetical protein ACIBG7_19495 [Nonomuraea sp. NPDC050328]|uniref:hypothetical protein n=1 Tax=Nonomuraea sp. NPDC050328 TaxID=3364361 RepID=UPI0037A6D421
MATGALVGGILVAGGAAVAASGPGDTIYGCVGKSGAVRIVAAKTKCPTGQTKVSWNRQGLQGMEGPPGAPGAQGAKGDALRAGATGAQGPKGDTGPKGDKGDKGETGARGPQGRRASRVSAARRVSPAVRRRSS